MTAKVTSIEEQAKHHGVVEEFNQPDTNVLHGECQVEQINVIPMLQIQNLDMTEKRDVTYWFERHGA